MSRWIMVAALLAFQAPQAWAYNAQGQVWPNPAGEAVPFMLSPQGFEDVTDDSEFAAIRRGFATWAAVTCSHLSFTEVTWAEPRQVRNDRSNRIMVLEDEAEWPGESGTLALTYTFYALDGSNRITDADMIFNAANWTWTTVDAEVGQGTPAKVDIETVAFHEIGHFFGLDHSSEPAAAMYPSNNTPIQRQPAMDDILGICALYPNGEPVPGTNNQGGPPGAACQSEQNCASGLCLQDTSLNRSYCSERCTPAQNNCSNGLVCEETEAFGALCFVPLPTEELCDQCVNSEQCSSGLCLRVPGVNGDQPFCTRACDPTPGQPQQCPGGFQCQTTQTTTGFVGSCVPNSGICDPNGKGGQNEICYANGECKAAHFCLEYSAGSGLDFCYAQCDGNSVGQPCGLERTICTPLPGDRNLAACITYAGEGEPCVPEVCIQGTYCAWDEIVGVDTAICYRTCNGTPDCPANHQCQQNSGIPSLCVPNTGFKLDGQGCTANAECTSQLCRIIGNTQLCTQTCSTQDVNACSAGLRCLPDSGSTQGLCWPSQLSDPNASERERTIGELNPKFCGCDSTNSCDSNCACDPECEGCGCTAAESDGSPWWLLAALFLLIRRRRKW